MVYGFPCALLWGCCVVVSCWLCVCCTCTQVNALDTKLCSVTGSLTIPLDTLGATCACMDDDLLVIGTAEGNALAFRVRGLSSTYTWPAAGMRPTRVLKGAMATPVEAVAVDRSADTVVVCYRSEAWVYELSRGRLMARLALPHPSLTCRSACIVDGSFIVLSADDAGMEPELSELSPATVAAAPTHTKPAPFLGIYRNDGTLYKGVSVPAAISTMQVERRTERWGSCLVTGDTLGIVSFYNPLHLEVCVVPRCSDVVGLHLGVRVRVCAARALFSCFLVLSRCWGAVFGELPVPSTRVQRGCGEARHVCCCWLHGRHCVRARVAGLVHCRCQRRCAHGAVHQRRRPRREIWARRSRCGCGW